ncbi:MAG: hypothetical protein SFT68_03315 [Rickettsiaceae bacterium]|nr:hypothetical protein [Rickettsiaceae bacterium]
MKSIKSLIKLAQKTLDQSLTQKKIKLLEIESMINEIKAIEKDILTESANFFDTPYASSLEQYTIRARARQRGLNGKIEQIQNELQILEKDILENYEELKRFEAIEHNMQKKQLLEMLKIERSQHNSMVQLKYSLDPSNN